MRRALATAVLALWAGLAWAAEPSLAQRQADARKQQAELRARIESLQQDIDSRETTRRDAANELKASESAISAINRTLAGLESSRADTQRELQAIEGDITEQKKLLGQRQQELGDQLRAQYSSGLSPWTALLSGDDPQVIGRDLSYLGYITKVQAEAVRAVRAALDKLARLQADAQAHHKKLAQLADETTEQKASLEAQKEERQQVLARIDAQLKEQRGQAERLAHNDQRLGDLITGLDKAIAKQVEEARIAEEKRRAEAARKAERERQAALERQRELARKREEARKAELAAKAAQEAAQRRRDQHEAEQARLQVEKARAEARAAEEAQARSQAPAAQPPAPESISGSVAGLRPGGRAEDQAAAVQGQPGPGERGRTESGRAEPGRAEPSPAREGQAATQVARLPPPGGFKGLSKNLPRPVGGEVLGRFGAERPEGGLWRGIVLRSPEGTPVHAVAAGRVVYANWLGGFGNIMIIDHGAKYLSVYAYNQSLLKRVGDVVAAGDTVATVGATGGQVDSGLYFEIRHQGTPVNPLLWLRR